MNIHLYLQSMIKLQCVEGKCNVSIRDDHWAVFFHFRLFYLKDCIKINTFYGHCCVSGSWKPEMFHSGNIKRVQDSGLFEPWGQLVNQSMFPPVDYLITLS